MNLLITITIIPVLIDNEKHSLYSGDRSDGSQTHSLVTDGRHYHPVSKRLDKTILVLVGNQNVGWQSKCWLAITSPDELTLTLKLKPTQPRPSGNSGWETLLNQLVAHWLPTILLATHWLPIGCKLFAHNWSLSKSRADSRITDSTHDHLALFATIGAIRH